MSSHAVWLTHTQRSDGLYHTKTLWTVTFDLFAKVNMVMPVTIENCPLANRTVCMSKLVEFDANSLVKGQGYWEIFLPTDPAKYAFL